MALTSTTQIDGSLQSWDMPHGLKISRARVTIGATADYSATGIPLTASKLGMARILTVFGINVRQSNGTQRALVGLWDPTNSKIRLYTGALVEITPATHLAAADILDCIVLGIG